MRDGWLTTNDAAEALGVTAETIRRYIRDRRLRASAIVQGERVVLRIRVSDFEAFRAARVRDTSVDDWEG
jgi:excisionase family DNA binding protein